jgi:hypothetical protein
VLNSVVEEDYYRKVSFSRELAVYMMILVHCCGGLLLSDAPMCVLFCCGIPDGRLHEAERHERS